MWNRLIKFKRYLHKRAEYNHRVHQIDDYLYTHWKIAQKIHLINAVIYNADRINKYITNKSLYLTMKITSKPLIRLINAIKNKSEKMNNYIADKSLYLTMKIANKIQLELDLSNNSNQM